MERRAVIAPITLDGLAFALGLGTKYRITAVLPLSDADVLNARVRLLIESPDFRPLLKGEVPPVVNLQQRYDQREGSYTELIDAYGKDLLV